MCCSRVLFLLPVFISQVYTTPQFLSFKDGKLGVNFAGFHAGIGIGGGQDNSGTSGGLFAEAGTPFGQSAKAGLSGAVGGEGSVSGSLYAGATGGENLKVSAGIGGKVNNQKSNGGGFATAQAGKRLAFAKMAGESVQFETSDSQALEVNPIHEIKTNIEATNEVKPSKIVPVEVQTKVEEKDIVKNAVIANAEQQPQVVEKGIVHMHNKPRRHNFRKTAFLGGHIGPGGEIIPPVAEGTKSITQRRIDVDSEANSNGAVGEATQTQTKLVTYQKNPSFFADIFNIPISTLQAVGALLSNTASNTRVSVQKSATVEAAESDARSVNPDPSSVSSSSAHISVETPSASKIIDDIFSIPINTLSAVNKFLENNVSGRKTVQILREGGEPTRVKLGPLARRRANKKVVIVHENANQEVEEES